MNVINIILAFLICLAITYLIYTLIKNNDNKEHFTEEEENVNSEEESNKEYQSRLNVMKVFDAILNRKPSVDEISTFAQISNEQDMITEVYEKYQNEIKEGLVTSSPTEKPSVVSEAKTKLMEESKDTLNKINNAANMEEKLSNSKALTAVENITTTTGGNVVIESPTLQSVVADIIVNQDKIDNLHVELRKSLSTLDKMLGGTSTKSITSSA